MEEYAISDDNQILAVATSSVREAANADSFRDRVYVATGISLKGHRRGRTEQADLSGRSGGFQKQAGPGPSRRHHRRGRRRQHGALSLPAGPGELFDSYQLGTLRMRGDPGDRSDSERAHPPYPRAAHQPDDRDDEARRPHGFQSVLVAMSGDAQFAASQVSPDWPTASLHTLDVKRSPPSPTRSCPWPSTSSSAAISWPMTRPRPSARGFSPTPFCAARSRSRRSSFPKRRSATASCRELASERLWTDAFAEEVVRQAISLGEKYSFDEKTRPPGRPAERALVQVLQTDYHLDPRDELLLRVAALPTISGASSAIEAITSTPMYIIENSNLFGLSREELALVALIARYHRRALPSLGPSRVRRARPGSAHSPSPKRRRFSASPTPWTETISSRSRIRPSR